MPKIHLEVTLHVETLDSRLATENPYLGGPYEPTHDEVTLDDLEVVGEIPDT